MTVTDIYSVLIKQHLSCEPVFHVSLCIYNSFIIYSNVSYVESETLFMIKDNYTDTHDRHRLMRGDPIIKSLDCGGVMMVIECFVDLGDVQVVEWRDGVGWRVGGRETGVRVWGERG